MQQAVGAEGLGAGCVEEGRREGRGCESILLSITPPFLSLTCAQFISLSHIPIISLPHTHILSPSHTTHWLRA